MEEEKVDQPSLPVFRPEDHDCQNCPHIDECLASASYAIAIITRMAMALMLGNHLTDVLEAEVDYALGMRKAAQAEQSRRRGAGVDLEELPDGAFNKA